MNDQENEKKVSAELNDDELNDVAGGGPHMGNHTSYICNVAGCGYRGESRLCPTHGNTCRPRLLINRPNRPPQ